MTQQQPLPKPPPLETIRKRLPVIFPKGTGHRNYVTRDIAARTIFVMFYAGALEGRNEWIRPDQVTKMSDGQSEKTGDAERTEWTTRSLSPGKMKSVPNRWYAANTREPIRDETLRELINFGAAVKREGLPTASMKPAYALARDFAALFDERLSGAALERAVADWRKRHLSAAALARVRLLERAAGKSGREVLVTFPNKETRSMAAGPSSVLSRDVIEEFAPRFLEKPAVAFLSESRRKVVTPDNDLASAIGLEIEPDKHLPDIILADLGREQPLLVFVEAVVTDGAVTNSRKEALRQLSAGFGGRVAFVTAFQDRSSRAFRKLASELAWGTFVWFASEPDSIVALKDATTLESRKLVDLL